MGSMASSRNRVERRDRKLRRRRHGMRVDDAARRLAMIRAARLTGRPDSYMRGTAPAIPRAGCLLVSP